MDAAKPTSRGWHRPNKERSAGEPELSALFTGTPAHLVEAEVARLEQAVGNRGPAALLAQRRWSLMLSIHGSGDRLAAQSSPDWQLNAVFYDGPAIKQLFGDKAFVDCRDNYGPQRVVLVACQVSQSFNQLVVDTLSRSGKGLRAGGLDPMQGDRHYPEHHFQAAGAQAESKYTQRAQ